jgi:hypothetical protein
MFPDLAPRIQFTLYLPENTVCFHYRGAYKSLARSTSRCILFDGENISFDASLVIYIYSTNIPPIMIINRIYKHQKSSVAVACFLPGRAKDLSAPLYKENSVNAVQGNIVCLYISLTRSNSRLL